MSANIIHGTYCREAESAILEKLEKQYLDMLGKASIAKLQGMMRETDTAGS